MKKNKIVLGTLALLMSLFVIGVSTVTASVNHSGCSLSGEVTSNSSCIKNLYGSMYNDVENRDDSADNNMFKLSYVFEVTGISSGSDTGNK